MKNALKYAGILALAAIAPAFDTTTRMFDLDRVPRGLSNDGDATAIADQIQKTFKDFKDENDKLIKQVKDTGAENVTTRENVEKLNKTLTDLQSTLENSKKRSDDFELKLNRIAMGDVSNPKNVDVTKQLEIFNACNKVNLSPEEWTTYNKATNRFIRKGDTGLTPEMQNAMSVGQEAGGGVWVTPDVTGPMVKKIYETSPMRPLCTVVNITTDALEGLVDNGEATTGWVAEKQDRLETKTPEVGKYRINVHEQYAEPRITQQLLDDASFNVEGWLGEKVADKMARTENAAFISGNGSGKPRGFLDYNKVTTGDATRAWDAIQYIATGAAGAYGASNPADVLLDVVYALKAGYRQGATWLTNRAGVGAVRKLKDGQGNYLWVPGSATQPATLHGYPIAEGEDMPTIANNAFSLAFGNFKEAYIIVDRQGVRVLRDPYTAKPYVKFYTTKRVGGGLVNGEAIKLLKFATS